MHKSYLVVALLFISVLGHAQIDSLNSKRSFYYLYEGKAVLGDSLHFSQPVIGNAFITVDGIWDNVNDIMFFKDETGLYVNAKYSNSGYRSEFAVRTVAGKYNYYIQIPINKYLDAKSSGLQLGEKTKKGKSYIALGYNDPVPANASNIYKIMKNNPVVGADAKKLRNYNRWGTACMFVGIGAIAAGIGMNINREIDPYDYLTSYAPTIAGVTTGVVFVATGSFIILKSPDREEIVRKANASMH